MLSYQSMTDLQRKLYDQVKSANVYHNLLRWDRLGVADVQAVAEGLKVNTTLTVLDMKEHHLDDDGAKAFAEALKVNTTLTKLNLWANQIGEAGAQAIAEALKVNATLRTLYLDRNQIGDAGAKAIAEALKVNATLRTLYLDRNQFGDAGVQAIAKALQVNKTLSWLNLIDKQIGDAGAQALAEALRVNATLAVLYLRENRLGDAGAQAIAEALKSNTMLTFLDLWANQIGEAGAQAIAEALKMNSTLIQLFLNGNQIGDFGAKAFAEALRVNMTVQRLDLTGNGIGNLGAQAIDEARQVNDKCRVNIDSQINPLTLSLRPRLATAKDIQAVFHLLTGGPELEAQPASLPVLPFEIAEPIMDEAHYWQGVQDTKQVHFADIFPKHPLKVTVPRSIDENPIQVKAIRVIREWKKPSHNAGDSVVVLTVQDEQGAVRFECDANLTLVDSTLECVTIWRADHHIIREMREGWKVQLVPSEFSKQFLFESLYVGYV
ncbi:hypothetical protein CAOG_05488 [Capsaspora owczarzaki ATCC 30864]|uniref:hypothetical protein n=1 Tax=Capsaspora owczarzaki (strain ATCC 30864) TaxID=595528 RepID=UPI000352116C|nr:hypothetical protein CAOG_05488 [Capsaspora owczarzaki ATCC 30864]|eukprot:XP_004346161.2 hypothetical protein CAOG_05488 [Capsaspora owczarzaki ATCC 30864]